LRVQFAVTLDKPVLAPRRLTSACRPGLRLMGVMARV
jgi:hypothetical protein